MTLTLYSTQGCHLCEQAEALLNMAVTEGVSIRWDVVDIADDDELMSRYGVRIPVLSHTDSPVDLGWPFDLNEILKFTATNLCNDSTKSPEKQK